MSHTPWEIVDDTIVEDEFGIVCYATTPELAAKIAGVPAMLSALTAIVGIPHRLDGGDWDEIEEAQKIALAAIAKAGDV